MTRMDNIHFLSPCKVNGDFVRTLPILPTSQSGNAIVDDSAQTHARINKSAHIYKHSLETWLSDFIKTQPLPAFYSLSFHFIEDLSKKLLKNPQYREYPELIALGFWLRKSNLSKKIDLAKNKREEHIESQQALGLVAHFTPANVDTMFIYSWVASLLIGNLNIVRVASQDSVSKVLLLELINALFAESRYQEIASRNVFVSYDKLSDASQLICAKADARMMWGGNASVAQIQALPTMSHTKDFCFADKYSVAIVSDNVISHSIENIAQRLWRDTQAFQQQACSSPRVLYVIQQETSKSELRNVLKALFAKLAQMAKADKGDWPDIGRTNEHLLALQNLALGQLCCPDDALIALNLVSAISLDSLSEDALERHSGNGLFYVRVVSSTEIVADELATCLPDKLQTVSIAIEDHINPKIADSIYHLLGQRVKHEQYRVQALGEALDFSFHWDGYDLLRQLAKN